MRSTITSIKTDRPPTTARLWSRDWQQILSISPTIKVDHPKATSPIIYATVDDMRRGPRSYDGFQADLLEQTKKTRVTPRAKPLRLE